MGVIGHQGPRKAWRRGFFQYLAKPIKEVSIVLVVCKNSLALNTPNNNVMNSSRGIYARLSRHGFHIAKSRKLVNISRASPCSFRASPCSFLNNPLLFLLKPMRGEVECITILSHCADNMLGSSIGNFGGYFQRNFHFGTDQSRKMLDYLLADLPCIPA